MLWARHDPAAFGRPRSAFHLLPAVEAALDLCREELAGVIVARHVRPLRVLGSGGQITLVMIELLVQAAWATRATGRARVVHIDARDCGAHVRIRVSDNGVGLEARLRARARLAPASGAGGGTGMASALALADAIVQAHGSVLRCAERRPHGVRFAFELQAAPMSGMPTPDRGRPGGKAAP